MTSYAVLLAPEFRLQATLRHTAALATKPVALLEIHGTKSHVSELNALAAAHHVQRGMTPTQATARCEDIHFLHGNPGHERSAQDILLQAAEALSPFFEVTAPGVVTIELPQERSPTEAELVRRCLAPLQLAELDGRIGLAGTPDLAWLAARFARPVCRVDSPAAFLAPLPIDTLEPSAELLAILAAWGIRTIGQLAALPITQVCERLGPEMLALWERAHGGRARPLDLVKPREFFAEQTDLEHPVEMMEPLLFLLRRFLEQIATRLEHAYLVAGKLRLGLRFDRGDSYQRTFTIPQPTREVDLLFRMLRTHLENFTSESPIVAVELAARPVRPHAEQFSLLEKGLRDPHQFGETLARLQALLGPDRVGCPEIESSHHPDAFHLRAYDTSSPSPPSEEFLFGAPWLRFRPPVPAQVILNDVRPAFLYSTRCTGPIKDVHGPWRLEGNWWEDRHWTREDWDIVTDDGIYRLMQVKDKWFLDGIYA